MKTATKTATKDWGIITAPDTILFHRRLPGPIERVWEYLTDSDRRGEWLATGPMELRVGGTVRLDFHHADLSPVVEEVPDKYKDMEKGGSFTGRVTRCEPPRVLAYTWPDGSGESSEVTFELEAQDQDVLLTLTHHRLEGRETLISVASGWHTHLGILTERLSGRTPRPFWSAHVALEREYEDRLSTDVD